MAERLGNVCDGDFRQQGSLSSRKESLLQAGVCCLLRRSSECADLFAWWICATMATQDLASLEGTVTAHMLWKRERRTCDEADRFPPASQ